MTPHRAMDGASGSLEALESPERYQLDAVLGRGGMGEIRLCRDLRLGRQVAMKVVNAQDGSTSTEPIARLLREACVQGQLEHPAIVPVYDLGVGPDGEPYFTMKRVQGVTLEAVILQLRASDPAFRRRYSRRRLLTAFSSICMAVDFAHSRGVVHRDLKPANIMLGDFGEVYVLDWGLAKPTSREEEPPAAEASLPAAEPATAGAATPAPVDGAEQRRSSKTQAGVALGTPGYMSPEQAQGQPADARSDVYGLGALLFELLALEPLHEPDEDRKVMEATLAGADARASQRAPELDVPPELDALCVRATAVDPAARYPSARALHDDLERFLEGERDVELRRKLAWTHAKAAEEAAERALSERADAVDERRRALAEVSRALVLDSNNTAALMTLVRLLGEPPKQLPADVQRELAAADYKQAKLTGLVAALGYASLVLYIPLLLWMGVRSWTSFGVLYGLVVLSVAVAYGTTRRPPKSRWRSFITLAVSTAMIGAISVVFGPFLVLPSFAAVNAMAFAVHLDRPRRRWAIPLSTLALIVPSALRVLGMVPRSYSFGPEGMIVLPHMVDLPQGPTLALLFATTLATIVTSAVYVGRIRDALTGAEERLLLQAWHLRQMVPQEVGLQGSTDSPPAP